VSYLPAFQAIRLLIVIGYLGLAERTCGDTGFEVSALIPVEIYDAVISFYKGAGCAMLRARRFGAMAAAHREREKMRLRVGFKRFCHAPSNSARIYLVPVLARNGARVAAQTFVLIKYERSSHYAFSFNKGAPRRGAEIYLLHRRVSAPCGAFTRRYKATRPSGAEMYNFQGE
jgi:hypothetical protein